MTKFVNLTPHDIVCMVHSYDPAKALAEQRVFPKSGNIARVEQTTSMCDITDCDIVLFKTTLGNVVGLPEEKEDVLLIVSGMVRAALPKRQDLVSPGELFRDGNGCILGCQGFITNF